MRDYTTSNPMFSENVTLLDTTDTNHAENFNMSTKQLFENTMANKRSLDSKVTKGAVGAINMAMLATEVKSAMTGGSVAVVGRESVGFEQLAGELSDFFGSYNPVGYEVVEDALVTNIEGKASVINPGITSARYYYIVAAVEEGKRYKIANNNSVLSSSTSEYILYADDSSHVIGYVSSDEDLESNIYVTIPAGATKLLINYTGDTTDMVISLVNYDGRIHEEHLDDVLKDKLNNAGGGSSEGTGSDGGYYTPSVDADGNLTWAASDADMPDVEGVNIKGPQGEPGAVGTEGKSAYAYAKEGGYTGTEKEFAKKLSQEYVTQGSFNEFSAKTVNYITPEMYGATGDGVTDDSTAIQKAIDNASNIHAVYLGKKKYKISTGLIIRTNYTIFRCDGIIIYDGTDSAITLTNTLRSVIDINTIYAEKGTAIRLSNAEGRVTFNQISINNIHSSKIGIHLTTPNTENLEPIYYNKVSFMDIIATEIGIHAEAIGYYINENRYYGGTIGGGCTYGIKLDSTDYTTGQNKFLCGGIEGISDEGYGIYINNSSYNIFRNIRALERYGLYVLGIKGMSIYNSIELQNVKLSEVDISELGDIGNDSNVIITMGSSFDNSTRVGVRIEINGNYGFVYDTKKSLGDSIKVSLTNFPDSVINAINGYIYTSFQSTVNSLNGATITLGEVYYGIGSMIKGVPVVFSFGNGTGRIKLVDIDGNTIFDATDGKFDGKTVSVSWHGYDRVNARHVWLVNVYGETNMDGQDGQDGQDGVGIQSIVKTGTDELVDTYTITLSDGTTETFTVTNGKDGSNGNDGNNGYTPIKGTDYFTETEINEIVNAVYAKVADGNEVAY